MMYRTRTSSHLAAASGSRSLFGAADAKAAAPTSYSFAASRMRRNRCGHLHAPRSCRPRAGRVDPKCTAVANRTSGFHVTQGSLPGLGLIFVVDLGGGSDAVDHFLHSGQGVAVGLQEAQQVAAGHLVSVVDSVLAGLTKRCGVAPRVLPGASLCTAERCSVRETDLSRGATPR